MRSVSVMASIQFAVLVSLAKAGSKRKKPLSDIVRFERELEAYTVAAEEATANATADRMRVAKLEKVAARSAVKATAAAAALESHRRELLRHWKGNFSDIQQAGWRGDDDRDMTTSEYGHGFAKWVRLDHAIRVRQKRVNETVARLETALAVAKRSEEAAANYAEMANATAAALEDYLGRREESLGFHYNPMFLRASLEAEAAEPHTENTRKTWQEKQEAAQFRMERSQAAQQKKLEKRKKIVEAAGGDVTKVEQMRVGEIHKMKVDERKRRRKERMYPRAMPLATLRELIRKKALPVDEGEQKLYEVLKLISDDNRGDLSGPGKVVVRFKMSFYVLLGLVAGGGFTIAGFRARRGTSILQEENLLAV